MSLQLEVSNTLIYYLCELNNTNNIKMTDTDLLVLNIYQKVMVSSNYEHAEAAFATMKDKIANKVGFESFEQYEKEVSEAIKKGELDKFLNGLEFHDEEN